MIDVERQYARALFSLALEKEAVESTYQDLTDFINALDNQAKLFFLHPKIEIANKHQVIQKVGKNSLVINFLKVLLDNSRFELLPAIATEYQELINEMNETVEVMVYAKNELSATNIKKIKKKLQNKLLKNVVIKQTINESIIGGFKIEYQGQVIDETINSSLNMLKKTLTGGN
ncbi:MAG TPA: ATP synthase F1 subunit delta [Bacillota bacterium]|nr:ATP synthase F1 subunit delta [Bacillota bacterium]